MIEVDARNHALQACRKEGNVLGAAFFDEHLREVAGYAVNLAGTLGADPRVVTVASYLHDISAIGDIGTLPDHARLSAEQARAWIAERGEGADFADAVARCVATHSQPVSIGTAESICLSNADALAQIARPAYWLWFAFNVRKLGFEQGREWLRGLYERNWSALTPAAQGLGVKARERAMILLANTAGA